MFFNDVAWEAERENQNSDSAQGKKFFFNTLNTYFHYPCDRYGTGTGT